MPIDHEATERRLRDGVICALLNGHIYRLILKLNQRRGIAAEPVIKDIEWEIEKVKEYMKENHFPIVADERGF